MTQLRLRLYGRVLGQSPQAGVPLPVSWETAFDRLQTLPRMYAEPDGSFLWNGQLLESEYGQAAGTQSAGVELEDGEFEDSVPGTGRWQIEGTVFDDGVQVRRVELVGNCTREAWQRLLNCFGVAWSEISLEELTGNQVVGGDWLEDSAL